MQHAVGSPPEGQRKRAMMGGMSAAFGSRRDTSDSGRAAPLRGVLAAGSAQASLLPGMTISVLHQHSSYR